MEIAPRIRRIGSGMVNAYLVEDGWFVTIVDAGAPSYWGDLPTELAALGRSLEDVRAVVLTHGHQDHIGFAERIRRERGTPVRVHEADAALARGEIKNPAKAGGGMGAAVLSFFWFSLTHGMLRVPPLTEVSTFGDGVTLDVPGAPRIVQVPGHTAGSAALHFAGHDAVFVGDAIGTVAVTTGKVGPQLSPFNADRAQALSSLDRLDGLEAGFVLPGHGQAWTGGLGEALRLARASEPPD
jgi:glyoxylase-like metal-dependent hydrolase (beta-lactamase superfamily II)